MIYKCSVGNLFFFQKKEAKNGGGSQNKNTTTISIIYKGIASRRPKVSSQIYKREFATLIFSASPNVALKSNLYRGKLTGIMCNSDWLAKHLNPCKFYYNYDYENIFCWFNSWWKRR